MSTINDFDAPETPADTGHEDERIVSLSQSDAIQDDAAEPTLVMPDTESSRNANTTHPTVPDSATPAAGMPGKQPLVPGIWSWRRLPGRIGYMISGLPVAVVSFSVLVTLVCTGTSLLIITPVGMAILWATSYVSRAFGRVELTRLRWAGTQPIEGPRPLRAEGSVWHRCWSVIGDPDAWRATAHSMVNFVATMLSFTLTMAWIGFIAEGIATWILFGPLDLFGTLEMTGETLLPQAWRTSLNVRLADSVLGLVALITLPFLLFGLTAMHRGPAQGLLSRRRKQELNAQLSELNMRVDKLADAHTASADAEEEALRRLERNVHDGPQQQLLRMQIDLDTAKRRIADDPTRAAALLDEVRDRSQDTLEELRNLSRGLVHPLLVERGLGAALESLAERATVPVRVTNHLPATLDAPDALDQTTAQGLLLATSELLTNVTKHSGATRADVAVCALPDGDGGVGQPGVQGPRPQVNVAPTAVRVVVRDNGRGSAHVEPGHGLDGIARRMQGLGGQFELDSPLDGPTTVYLTVPLTDWSRRA